MPARFRVRRAGGCDRDCAFRARQAAIHAPARGFRRAQNGDRARSPPVRGSDEPFPLEPGGDARRATNAPRDRARVFRSFASGPHTLVRDRHTTAQRQPRCPRRPPDDTRPSRSIVRASPGSRNPLQAPGFPFPIRPRRPQRPTRRSLRSRAGSRQGARVSPVAERISPGHEGVARIGHGLAAIRRRKEGARSGAELADRRFAIAGLPSSSLAQD